MQARRWKSKVKREGEEEGEVTTSNPCLPLLYYAVADKVIRFKGYEFEILGVDKGQLRYRRVK